MDLNKIISDYEKNGFVIVKNVIENEEIERLRKEYFHVLNNNPDLREDEISSHILQSCSEWRYFIGHSDILNIVEAFIGSNIAHFYSRFFVKKPKIGREVPWHQDGAYYPLRPLELCTVWVGMSKSHRGNGGLRVIPGSHRQQLSKLKDVNDESCVLKRVMDQNKVNDIDSIDLNTDIGDLVIIHPHLEHASYRNNSDEWRMSIAIRYINTSTQITWKELYGKDWDCCYLLRGDVVKGIDNQYILEGA
ncbi:phytanoyl-CoA dioxygenase family protein [Vibrio mediterranei]|uniref:phytanoyl-CoA dioxygenase family protein n=1 Tax=Vibrio mediterranei TaxID=689 RepID=UPI001EFC7B78|nr:phytanoyl-CoA dioxygenase family protein [Vibrio mediterranei]MCG9628209.1 phytanoyl-CoA dioxygenase family protein [Vibrio mediterranei]